MKKLVLPVMALAALPAFAAIDISWPSNPMATISIEEKALANDSVISQSRMTLKAGKGSYTPQSLTPAQVRFTVDEKPVASVFTASPRDVVLMEIGADGIPLFKGTPLMEGISQLTVARTPLDAEFADIRTLSQTDMDKAQQQFEQWMPRYYSVFTDFIAANPDSPAVAYALLELDSDAFMKAYEAMTPAARASILMPLVEKARQGIEKKMAAEALMEQMQSGAYEAPAFTLPNLDGKPVSLDDFRGKWVVLDFWGAWCRWCVKGFPQLKEAYRKYEGKIEVIGIDNRDTPERWKEAVARYELPWVNVYNDTETPAGTRLLEQYAVQGFPTKVIVNPEGKIANITVGEDPNFFTILEGLVK